MYYDVDIEMTNRLDEVVLYENIKEVCFDLQREEMDICGQQVLELAREGHMESLCAMEQMIETPRNAAEYFLKFDVAKAQEAFEIGKRLRKQGRLNAEAIDAYLQKHPQLSLRAKESEARARSPG